MEEGRKPGAGIMEADEHPVTTVFTVQPSLHPRYSTNRVSWRVTIVGERAVTPHLVVRFMILGFVECRWWNDGIVKTVVTWRSSASMIPVPGYQEKTPDDELQKIPHTKARNSSLNRDTNPHSSSDRLVGLAVKASASRAESPGFESRLRRDFSGSSHTSDLKNWHSGGYPARRLAL